MSVPPAGAAPRGRAASFHHYGPWLVGGGAVVATIAYELVHHHVVSTDSALLFAAIIPSIILHEIAHGVVAYWCGDDTAKAAGRLSLNPLRHVDPVGSVLLPILLIAAHAPVFGWARPVPVNVNRLRHPRNQAVLVSLAGPATNVLIAFISGVALHFVMHGSPFNPTTGDYFLFALGYINLLLAAFNLIPIPPLDGSAVIERLLPASVLPSYYQIRMAMMVLVIAVVWFDQSALIRLDNWVLNTWQSLLFG